MEDLIAVFIAFVGVAVLVYVVLDVLLDDYAD